MAVFKLQEAARRLASLARESTSPEVRKQLQALADELCEQERRLWASIEDDSGDTDEAPRRAGGAKVEEPASRRGRRYAAAGR